MRAGEGRVCSLCALIDGVMLRRSAMLALIVGTFLVLLNQSDVLFGAQPLPTALYWKVPLTYCVPFCVATFGALSNARR